MTSNIHDKIKWGIIGLGNIAHKFAEDLGSIEGVELYAVASRSKEKSKLFALKYNATKAYSNYESLINDSSLDAVYIATPHAFHKEHSIKCLKKGIAVLCEKPFAMNISEVNEMITVATQNNVLLMEAMWTAFLPHFKYVCKLINNKTFGQIIKLEASFGFTPQFNENSRVFKKSLGGGSLLDIGIYPIFIALSTLGIPSSINAEASFFDNGADSTCNMKFLYNKAKAILKCSFINELSNEAIFYCEKGIIKINNPFHGPTNITVIENGKSKNLDFNYTSLGYSHEIEHFNKLINECKTESDIMTFNFSRSLINTLDSVRNIINLKY